MQKNERHEIRRTQFISPFGVGAIIEISGESFVTCDIHYWGDKGDRLDEEPRLQSLLGVRELRSAPAKPDQSTPITDRTPGLPVMRFPTWMFCQKCRRMFQCSPRDVPVCPDCSSANKAVTLTPMRFVVICSHGHLSDVDWVKWAHSGKVMQLGDKTPPDVPADEECRHRDQLEFRTIGRTSGPRNTYVRCRKCRMARNLDDLVKQEHSRGVIFCSGRQPWQARTAAIPCDAPTVQVVPRGATNVTFPVVLPSIDIPPNSDFRVPSETAGKVKAASNFLALKLLVASGDNGSTAFKRKLEDVADDSELSEDLVLDIVRDELKHGGVPNERPASKEKFRFEEYEALLAPDRVHHPRDKFIKRRATLDAYAPTEPVDYAAAVRELKGYIGELALVTRLREVRALTGFTRVKPRGDADIFEQLNNPGLQNGDTAKMVEADLGLLPHASRWLPAIEVYGEGIFFTLNAAKVAKWAQQPALLKRTAKLEARRIDNAPHIPTAGHPAVILLHTLAHILIRQLTFDCGYSSAALRERLYCDPVREMLGVLIYTADGDSEGTLGGLVRQGQPERFLPTFLRALQHARWCSSDPLCIESAGQGTLGLNLAACHACSLLPETSCELNNSLLDRATLVGTLGARGFAGFFDGVLQPLAGGFVR